ncbi:hypothetical protein [Salinisphaera aquimarina]|uniref:Uncharacterized protein n=1 Tax=Salinisphaera aquimarina TaxID=2094031 RepID=A0ABV7EK83_9GAMM
MGIASTVAAATHCFNSDLAKPHQDRGLGLAVELGIMGVEPFYDRVLEIDGRKAGRDIFTYWNASDSTFALKTGSIPISACAIA